jgi:uncharacterized membrane protein YcjF (UPF0283 family)
MEIAGIPEILIGWGVLAIAFCVFVFAWRRRWKMALWYDVIGTVLMVTALTHFNVVVSFGLVMIAIFRLMEFKRMHPKRNRYEL